MLTDNEPENRLVRSEEQLSAEGNDDLEVVNGKVLNITEDTAGADVKHLLAILMQYANVGHALTKIDKKMEYIVQIPLKYRKAVEAGELLMNENSRTGVIWPTLYKELENGRRKFVDDLPIKKEMRSDGNPFQSVAQSYQNLYLQQQISALADVMDRTLKAVERIEHGQTDDRIGLMIAGKAQILLALQLSPEERRIEISQGRTLINEAQKQFLQTLKRRVGEYKAIPESSWKRFWMEVMHGGTHQDWDKHFMAIQEYYSLYLQATQLLADSYAICGYLVEAEQVYEQAEQAMAEISFETLKTLRYIHPRNTDMLCDHPVEYVTADKEVCLEAAKDYDYVALKVSGAKLLEVFNNGL